MFEARLPVVLLVLVQAGCASSPQVVRLRTPSVSER